MEAMAFCVLLAMAFVGATYGGLCLTEVWTMHKCFWIRYDEADKHWQVISPTGQIVHRCPLETQATEWAERWNRTLGMMREAKPKRRPKPE
jgi:hypothetical protein